MTVLNTTTRWISLASTLKHEPNTPFLNLLKSNNSSRVEDYQYRIRYEDYFPVWPKANYFQKFKKTLVIKVVERLN